MRVESQTLPQATQQEIAPMLLGNKAALNVGDKPDKTTETKKPEKTQDIKDQDLQEAVDFTNNVMKMSDYHLQFIMPEKGSKVQVKVIDNDSGNVIREIPPDYMMNIAKQLQGNIDKACGITVDELV